MSATNPAAQGDFQEVPVTHAYPQPDAASSATYRFEIAICPEEEGGYSVLVPELAGVTTQGESIDEAAANAIEAIEGALLVYKEDGAIPIRRENQPALPANCIRRWVIVNV